MAMNTACIETLIFMTNDEFPRVLEQKASIENLSGNKHNFYRCHPGKQDDASIAISAPCVAIISTA